MVLYILEMPENAYKAMETYIDFSLLFFFTYTHFLFFTTLINLYLSKEAMILNTNKISFWWNFSCEHILLSLYFRARESQWDESQLFVWLWFSGSKEHRSIMDNGVWSKKALKKIFQTFCVEKVFKSFLHFSESLRSILNYKILLTLLYTAASTDAISLSDFGWAL